MVRPIINSEKRIGQITRTTIPSTTVQRIPIARAVTDVTAGDSVDVAVGSVIKAVYLEYWFMGDGNVDTTITTTFEKKPSNAPNPDSTTMGGLNIYSNKKNLFEIHQGIIGDNATNPVPFYRGWVKIPKGKQRMGLGDELLLTIKAIVGDAVICGLTIYKVYN